MTTSQVMNQIQDSLTVHKIDKLMSHDASNLRKEQVPRTGQQKAWRYNMLDF